MKQGLKLVVGDINIIGGVSTHVKRLIPRLEEAGIEYSLSSHRLSSNKQFEMILMIVWLFSLLFKRYTGLIHFHKSFGWYQYVYWFLFSKINSKKIFITLHNSTLISYTGLKLRIALFFLRNTKYLKLIVVSNKVYDLLKAENIECILLPAYIPASDHEEITLASKKRLFLYSVYIGNKSNLNSIYGFDIALSLLKLFKDDLSMLFMIGNKDKSDIDFIEHSINSYGLSKSVTIIYNRSLVSYVRNCEFLLRPNRSDGYALSLEEALDQNVIPIASDVSARPKGTLIFDNFKDLVKRVKEVLEMSNAQKEEVVRQRQRIDCSTALIELYRHCD